MLELGDYPDIPILLGVCSNEGAFMQGLKTLLNYYVRSTNNSNYLKNYLEKKMFSEMWLELAREGNEALKQFVTKSILPNILVHYNLTMGASEQVKRLIYWRFFDQIPEKPAYMLNAMQRMISETKFETPFLETIERLTGDKVPLSHSNETNVKRIAQRKARKQFFVYSLHNSKSVDIRGAVNYFGGTAHTSDLLFMMCPSLFQQISRRKLTSAEMRLCRKFRHLWSEFIKTGDPTPGVHTSNAWHPYTSHQKFIQILSDSNAVCDSNDATLSPFMQDGMFSNALERNFVEIERLIHDQARIVSSNIVNPFRIGEENLPDSPVDSARMSKNYFGHLAVNSSSAYYNALQKIHSFWVDLLPKISLEYDPYRNYSNGIYSRSNFDDKSFISMLATNNTKFKHAFLSMLFLVCLLLVVLCICVYILNKNQQNIGVSFL